MPAKKKAAKKVAKTETPKVEPAVVETVNEPEKGASVRIRDRGL